MSRLQDREIGWLFTLEKHTRELFSVMPDHEKSNLQARCRDTAKLPDLRDNHQGC